MIAVLIKAGADVDSRDKTGVTPLWVAASVGPDATTELLRAKANTLLSAKISEGFDQLPLDVAAHEGHARVVHELISQVGIEGCAGASGGVGALQAATMAQHLDIMAMLMDAGVADSGRLLRMAAGRGLVAIVKLLLQQRHRGRDTSDGEGEYVNLYDGMGMTPLFYSIDGDGDFRYLISPKVVRLLIDAGADTLSAFLIAEPQGGEVLFSGTPLAYTNHCIREKQVGGSKHAATEEQMYRLEAVRRLLMRVEAVHAACWLWPREPRPVGVAAQVPSRKAATKTPENGTHLVSTLPILRRRRRGVLLAPLFRWAGESFRF